GGEDEAGRIAADAVDNVVARRDIAAHYPEGLAERAFDQSHPAGYLIAFGNAAAMVAVHADGVNLVEISKRSITVGEVADVRNRRDVAVHRIAAFEGDQLG